MLRRAMYISGAISAPVSLLNKQVSTNGIGKQIISVFYAPLYVQHNCKFTVERTPSESDAWFGRTPSYYDKLPSYKRKVETEKDIPNLREIHEDLPTLKELQDRLPSAEEIELAIEEGRFEDYITADTENNNDDIDDDGDVNNNNANDNCQTSNNTCKTVKDNNNSNSKDNSEITHKHDAQK